jgi:hypothetical protein
MAILQSISRYIFIERHNDGKDASLLGVPYVNHSHRPFFKIYNQEQIYPDMDRRGL